jgi:pyruvate kinase
MLARLIQNGMSIARLNFSHGTLSEHGTNIAHLKRLEEKEQRNIPILIDLPGIKIRIGKLASDPLVVPTGSTLILTIDDKQQSSDKIPVLFPDLLKYIKKGSKIFLNDGFIELKVTRVETSDIFCKVIIGGILRSYKGINLPDANIRIPSITPKDIELIEFGIQKGVSIFGLSFIQSVQDIEKVRRLFENEELYLIAKIERKESLNDFDRILRAADGIMIARGDLGIQVPLQKVPLIQKELIRKANLAGKPVITATQMLKSMTENTRPTRAEVADVANAILDGTDALMLSEETAIGLYPVETVRIMGKIAAAIEKNHLAGQRGRDMYQSILSFKQQHKIRVADVISLNVMEAQDILHPRYIIVTTSSGTTARRVSRFKPASWILTFSQSERTCQFLPFSYGVYPINLKRKGTGWHDQIIQYILDKHLVKTGDVVLLTQRRFTKEHGGTDSLGIITIDPTMKN